MFVAGLIISCGARTGEDDRGPTPQRPVPSGVTAKPAADPLGDSEPGTGQGIEENNPPK
jgi:hypothetical protein